MRCRRHRATTQVGYWKQPLPNNASKTLPLRLVAPATAAHRPSCRSALDGAEFCEKVNTYVPDNLVASAKGDYARDPHRLFGRAKWVVASLRLRPPAAPRRNRITVGKQEASCNAWVADQLESWSKTSRLFIWTMRERPDGDKRRSLHLSIYRGWRFPRRKSLHGYSSLCSAHHFFHAVTCSDCLPSNEIPVIEGSALKAASRTTVSN